jgi:hypothetical protein
MGPSNWAENSWLGDSDLGFLPFWDGHDPSVLRSYVEDYEGLVLPDSVVDNATAVRTARAGLPALGTLAGLTGRSKGVERFDIVVSSAWWAVQKHGETQVWSGNRLVRLNSDDKHLKRKRYADAIEALGCDVSAVLADDPTETVRCAVLSWLQMERHVSTLLNSRLPVVTSGHPAAGPGSVMPLRPVVTATGPNGHGSVVSAAAASNLLHLPNMGLTTITTKTTDPEGNEVEEHHEHISVTAESARQCSTCQLSAACPMFSPGSACSYKIPVVIRTKDQRRAVFQALCEIQTQRIMMGSFSEQVLGTPDVQVGKEMDRLFAMVEKWKTIEDQTAKLKVSVEASGDGQGPAMGVISRLFGEQAGTNAKLLDRPMMVDELIDEAEMVDEDLHQAPN